MLFRSDALLEAGATVAVFDPEAMANSRQVLGEKVSYADHQYEALNNADALIIATEWNEFRTPDFERIGQTMKNKVIFDGRNLFDLQSIEKMGFHYESIGRKPIH